MASYVSGTVLGGFLGRYISGIVAHNFAWREAFIAIGLINLAGAIIVHRSLPMARNFVRAASVAHSLSEGWQHMRNPRLVAVFGMGFTALFCSGGNVYLRKLLSCCTALPFELGTTRQRVLRVSPRIDCDASIGTLPRSLWSSPGVHRGRVFHVGGSAADTGALARCHRCRSGTGVVRSFHLPGSGNGADRHRRRTRSLVGRRIVRHVLLHWRKPGRDHHRLDMGGRRMAGVCLSADECFGTGAGDGVCEQQQKSCQLSAVGKLSALSHQQASARFRQKKGRHRCRPSHRG